MTSNLATTRPTRAQLLAGFGRDYLSTEALLNFCALPEDRLALIRDLAQPEDWGDKNAVLLRYLAVHVPLAIEQGRYVWSGEQLVMRAGCLTTAEGAAIQLGWTRTERDRWALAWAGERPSTVEALLPPDLGVWPELDPRFEVVLALDQFRTTALAGLPLVLQNAAITGAVEWSIRRGLAARQLHHRLRGYFVPVHLADRAGAPELVAAVQVQSDRLMVRTLLEPRLAYPQARPLFERREQMPSWLDHDGM
jgi:hypothetical protein